MRSGKSPRRRRTTTCRARGPRCCTVPLVVALDGTTIVNAIGLSEMDDPEALLAEARATGLPVFVGVVVPPALAHGTHKDLDDALAEAAARLLPAARGRSPGRA